METSNKTKSNNNLYSHIRGSYGDIECLRNTAKRKGLSVGEYIRMKCSNFEPKNAMSDDDKIRYHEILETRKNLKAFLDELNVKLKDYTPEARLAYLLSDATFGKWADAIGDVLHDLDLIRIKYAGQQ